MKNLIKNIAKTLLFFDLIVIIEHFFIDLKNENPALEFLFNNLIKFIVVMAFTVFFLIFIEKNRIKIPFKTKPLKAILGGGAVGLALPLFCSSVLVALGTVEFLGFNEISNAYYYLSALLLSVTFNELLLRGYLFSLYKKHFKFLGATLISTALCISLNTNLFSGNVFAIINLILINLVICFVYDFSGNFLSAVSLRFFYSLVSGFAVGSFNITEGFPVLVNSSAVTGAIENSWILTAALAIVVIFFLCHKYALHKKIKTYAPIILNKIKTFNIHEFFINVRFKLVMFKKRLPKSKSK